MRVTRRAFATAGVAILTELPATDPRAAPHLGAQRITDFVAQHPDTLGYLSPLAVTPRRQLAAGHPALQPVAGAGADVVPLEALRVPAALDGSAGLNRAPVPAHQAELATDLQAVHA
ncbi:hypothetical protein WT74_28110 [Burkholderia stagnalis]|nr:hypothetical protein WT74_28110 [Burkholderia stagnalis]